MNDKIVKEIDLDFYSNKIVSVDAKQYDIHTRYILIVCHNQGGACVLDKNIHKAYVRYKKPDESIVFNSCEITEDGKVLVALTQQMLAVPGSCAADLLIAGKDKELHNTSTMQFFVNVLPAPYPNEEVESSGEYTALQDLMDKALSDYESVKENAQKNADNAAASAENARTFENNAAESAICAAESASDSADSAANSAKSAANSAKSASDSAGFAADSAKSASDSAEAASHAESSKNHAAASAVSASDSALAAAGKAEKASSSAAAAVASEANAADSAAKAESWSDISKSYAVGTNDEVRENDSSDNARYYYEQSLRISQALSGGLLAKGTISFAELEQAAKSTGYMYNIRNSFVSDDSFVDGGGIYYGAGSNVYYTADGMWDVLAASVVSGVKGSTENEYRQGLVNISKDNIGLENVDNTADTDKSVKYAANAGNAATAESLIVSAGNSGQPVYFKDGKPVACELKFAALSQAAYNGLAAKDSHTVYFITS